MAASGCCGRRASRGGARTCALVWQHRRKPPHAHCLHRRLRAKPVRTASGIAVVAVMSKPHRCPHIATTGNICIYCPVRAARRGCCCKGGRL